MNAKPKHVDSKRYVRDNIHDRTRSLPVISSFVENPMTGDRWVCDNINFVKVIDRVEFWQVHKIDDTRQFLIRKDAHKKVSGLR